MAGTWSRESWAHTGSAKLFMFGTRLGAPDAIEQPRSALFLVHGSSSGTQSGFGLTVQGQDESILNWFAQACADRVARVVLDAFVWTGKDAPTLIGRRENPAYFRTRNRRPVNRAFFHTTPRYDKTAATLAWDRTIAFLNGTLR